MKHDEAAKRKAIHIISGCGYQTLCDLGVRYVKKNFKGKFESIDTYLSMRIGNKVLNNRIFILKH